MFDIKWICLWINPFLWYDNQGTMSVLRMIYCWREYAKILSNKNQLAGIKLKLLD